LCEGNLITFALFMHAWNKFMRAWSLSQLGHWLGPVTGFELLGPAQSHGPS
jgi:hypothetical protein